MSKFILVEAPDGSERALVKKLDGYEGWKVLGKNLDMPDDDDDWDDEAKKFKPNENRKKLRAKQRAMRDPDALIAIIDDLTKRLEILEGKVK